MIKKEYIKKKSDNPIFQKGFNNEADLAYFLDFEFKDDPDTMVIHDYKINYNGRVAQIDHLVIRPAVIYVIETKYYGGKLKFNNKDWTIMYPNKMFSVPSPIAQNERHIKVLKDMLENEKSIFENLKKHYKNIPLVNVILISNKTIFYNKPPKNVFKIDEFSSFRKEYQNNYVKNVFKSLFTLNIFSFIKIMKSDIIKNEDMSKFADNLLKFDISEKNEFTIEDNGAKMFEELMANFDNVYKNKDLENAKNEENLIKEKELTDIKDEDKLIKEKHSKILKDLKEIRLNISKDENLPAAYYIFSDMTLDNMAKLKPQDKASFMKVFGVGQKKYDLYGEKFIQYFKDNC